MTPVVAQLRAEAAAEAGRLARARAMLRDGDRAVLERLESDAVWLTRSRRGRTRRALAGRICLIWRATFEDASGRTAESHLIALLVRLDRARPSSWLEHIESELQPRVDGATNVWREEVARANRAFAAARAAREEAIRGAMQIAPASSQPGLFDRRVDRHGRLRAIASAAEEEELAERRGQASAAATLIRTPPRLVLVLVP